MTEYPTPRELCGVYFRVERNGEWQNVCFSDMTHEEREEVVAKRLANRPPEMQASYWHNMADIMADTLHEIGDQLDIVREDGV